MTRYTELRHAGYYQHGLTNTERETIAAQVDGTTVESPPQPEPAAKKTLRKSSKSTK